MLEHEQLIESRFSAWQNRQVRTIVVSSRSKIAAQRSISTAIASAKPFDRIELVGGEYFETISVTFPIELVASEGEDVKISFRGSCLTLATECAAYIENIHFFSKSRHRNETAITITAGTAEFSRCRISSVTLCGSCSPTFTRCKISESVNGVGVRVVDRGGGHFDSCEISAHATVCMEVDTVGKLTVQHCSISQPNGSASVIAVQAVASCTTTRHGDSGGASGFDDPGLCCREVLFKENRIFSSEGPAFTDASAASFGAQGPPPIPVMSTFGASCCALISHSAQPVFEGNEFSEGMTGMIFEKFGSARLLGNIFRLQRVCGIFFLLPESATDGPFGSDISSLASVKITHHNLFDRCRIGVDVQCGLGGAASIFQSEAEAPLRVSRKSSPEPRISIGSAAAAHSWLTGIEQFTRQHVEELAAATPEFASKMASRLREPGTLLSKMTPVRIREVTKTTAGAVAEFLLSLIEEVLLAHPHVLKQSRIPAHATPSGYLATTHAASTFGFLTALLEDAEHYRPSLRRTSVGGGVDAKHQRTVAAESLEVLRGGFGIHIVDTKFLNCTFCGVRFGHGGRGLVDSCSFDRCGVAAVLSESGSYPMLVGCTFLNNSATSVQISHDADPLVVCNTFESSSSTGISVSQFSRGVLLGNVVSGSETFGVILDDCSSTIIAHNFFTRNKAGGLKLLHSSRPLILSNQFSGNFGPQVVVSSCAAPTFVLNRVISGGTQGLLFTDCGGGTIVGNSITFQSGDGVVVELDADPFLDHNHIASNKGNGILIRNNGSGTVSWNTIEANELHNVRIQEGGSCVVRANLVVGGFLGGVCVSDEGAGLVEKNTILRNGLANVLITGEHSEPLVMRNEIAECYSGVGVLCADRSAGVVDGNVIHNDKTSAIEIRTQANPSVRRNRIFGETAGVVVCNGGRGVVDDNAIYDLDGTGLVLESYSDATARRNTFSACGLAAIIITPDARGLVETNSISTCGIGIIAGWCRGTANSSLSSELTQKQQQPGAAAVSARMLGGKANASPLAVAGSAAVGSATLVCLVTKNTIQQCDDCGVLLESGANAVFEENTLCENGPFGVLCDVQFRVERLALLAARHRKLLGADHQDAALSRIEASSTSVAAGVGGGTAKFISNKISLHKVANVASLRHTTNTFHFAKNSLGESPSGFLVRNGSMIHTIRDNVLQHHHEGLVFERDGRGNASGNVIESCSLAGIYIASGSDPVVSGCRVSRCGAAGVLLDAGARGLVEKCRIQGCYVGLIAYTSAGDAGSRSESSLSATSLVENCEIRENELHGVLILACAHPLPLRVPRDLTNSGRNDTSSATNATPPSTDGSERQSHMHAELDAYRQVLRNGDRRYPLLRNNRISRNRFFGVFSEKFHHLELTDDFGPTSQDADEGANAIENEVGKTPRKQQVHRGADDALRHNKSRRPHLVIDSPVALKPSAAVRRHTAAAAAGSSSRDGGNAQDGASCDSDSDKSHHLMATYASVVDCEVYDNSFGVGVSQESQLLVLRCNVHHNSFFGMLFRSTSQPHVAKCSVHDNGIAGVYAARFSSGAVVGSTIASNNLLCRDPSIPNQKRSAAAFVTSQHFLSSVLEDDSWRSPPTASPLGKELLSASLNAMLVAFRQVTTVAEVHSVVLEGAITVLGDLIAAPSNALSVASSMLPNPYFNAASRDVSRGSDSLQTASSSSTMEFASSILDASNMAPISDGGMGIWLEEGSQVEITECTISHQRHTGVLFSRGLLAHHHVLRQSFERSQADFSIGGSRSWQTTSRSRYAPVNAGVLFSHQTLVNNAATAGADSNIFDKTATFIDAAALLSSGTLTSSAGAAGVGGSPWKVGGVSSPHASPDQRGTASQAPCSGCPVVRSNRIVDNERDGIRIQLFHNLIASAMVAPLPTASTVTFSSEASDSAAPPQTSLAAGGAPSKKAVGVKTRKGKLDGDSSAPKAGETSSSSSKTAAAPLATRRSVPLSHLFDADVAALQYSIVVEENEVVGNSWRGVLCEHIAEINCSSLIPNRVALNERFEEQASQLTSDFEVALRSGTSHARAVRQLTVQRLVVEAGRLTSARNANIRSNALGKNGRSQMELGTRFVVYTGDKQRTLLYLDPTFDPSIAKSMFAFQSLMRVPLIFDLTLCPAPGIFLVDSNRFTDARVGVLVAGIVATQSSRIRGNEFTCLSDAAIVLDGPRAAACIGDGNTFSDNRVGVHFKRSLGDHTSHHQGSPDGPSVGDVQFSSLSAARVYKNVFRRSRVASVLIETLSSSLGKPDSSGRLPAACTLLPVPVIFKNEFSLHSDGSTGVLIAGSLSSASLHGNVFTSNVIGVIVAARSGTGGLGVSLPSDTEVLTVAPKQRHVALEQNRFVHNVVGCVVSTGATANMTSNYFYGNAWCGLLVGGGGNTFALVKNCCFDSHSPEQATRAPPNTLPLPPSPYDSTTGSGNRSPLSRAVSTPCTHSPLTIGDAHLSVVLEAPLPLYVAGSSHELVPVGLVLDPLAGALVEETLFMNNDVGIDLLRDVMPHQLGYLEDTVTVDAVSAAKVGRITASRCIFRGHVLAGVHGRGSPGRLVRSATSSTASTTGAPRSTAAPQAADGSRDRIVSLRVAQSDAVAHKDVFTAVVDASFFEGNGSASSGGDVVLKWFGHCHVKDSCFYSTVRSLHNGYGLISRCAFLGDKQEVGFVAESLARTTFRDNIVRERRIGVRLEQGSFASVESNLLTSSSIAVETEAFCSSLVSRNVVALAEDCGMLLRGGVVSSNTISTCPVGVIIRDPDEIDVSSAASSRAQAAARNPSSSPDAPENSYLSAGGNYELQLLENVIHSCDADGVLVGGSGRIEANHVSYCKTNVNVVCAAKKSGSSDGGSVPRITKNFVFDGQYGVVLAAHSVCFLTNNEVFDNSLCGVVCQPQSSGLVESNHISCAMDHGALEIMPESDCQVHHNTVRNQFSPAYNRGLAQQRVKERQRESSAFAAALGVADERVSKLLADAKALSTALTQLYGVLQVAGGSSGGGVFPCVIGGEAHASAVGKGTGDPRPARPRALSFESFESVTAALTNLVAAQDVAASSRGVKRANSVLARAQQLKAKEGGRGNSATASSLLRDARRSTLAIAAAQNEGSADSGSASHSRQQRKIVIHVFDGLRRVTGSSESDAQQRPAAATEVLNAIGGALHGPTRQPSTTMVTWSASEIASVFKAQAPPDAVILVVPPASSESFDAPQQLSAEDEGSLSRIRRVLQGVRPLSDNDTAPRSLLLYPIGFDVNGPGSSNPKSAHLSSGGVTHIGFRDFTRQCSRMFPYRDLDHLQFSVMPTVCATLEGPRPGEVKGSVAEPGRRGLSVADDSQVNAGASCRSATPGRSQPVPPSNPVRRASPPPGGAARKSSSASLMSDLGKSKRP